MPRSSERTTSIKVLSGRYGIRRAVGSLSEAVAESGAGERVARAVGWTLSGSVAARVVALGASVAAARILGGEGFGGLNMVQNTAGMLCVFTCLGFGVTATRYVAVHRERDPGKTGRIIALSEGVPGALSLLAGIALAIFAPLVAGRVLDAPELTPALRCAPLLLIMSTLTTVQSGVLTGYESFKSLAAIGLIAGGFQAAGVVLGAWFAGIPGAVVGMGLGLTLNWGLARREVRRQSHRMGIFVNWAGATGEWKIIPRFGLPAFFSELLMGPAHWVAQAIIVNQPGGYFEMGMYGVAMQWRSIVLYVPSLLTTATLPVLSELAAKPGQRGFRGMLFTSIGIASAGTLAVAIPLSLLSRFILSAYGEEFTAGVAPFALVMLTGVIVAALQAQGQFYAGEERMWMGASLNAVWSLSLIGFTWLFREQGALGLAKAGLASYSLHGVLCIIAMKLLMSGTRN